MKGWSNGRAVRPIAERLWEKVDRKGGPEACWPWRGARDKDGYGVLAIGSRTDGTNRTEAAHRLALICCGVRLAPGEWALHDCDNPPCCNPKHLYVGAQSDNVHDRSRRGRGPHGGNNPRAKLTEDQVRSIRRMRLEGQSAALIARTFGLSWHYVYSIFRKQRWKHLQEEAKP